MRAFKLVPAVAVALVFVGGVPRGGLASTPGAQGGGTGVVAERGGVEWIRLPGGTFQMGSNDGESDELPVHGVTVGTFEMAKTETTVAQYKKCVEAGSCTAPRSELESCNWGKPGRDNHPVNCLDWDQALAYAGWVGGRLPTEAEWEYAARSGGRDQNYPWGSQEATCDLAVIDGGTGNGCGQDGTWAVCSKTAGNTSQGLCDMSGNVWEWIQDWHHSNYTDAPSNGSAWEKPSPARVVRGGSWNNVPGDVRGARRDCNAPDSRLDVVGVRPVRSVP